MTNAQRRQIIDDAKARGYQGSYVDLFRQAAMNPESVVRHGTQASMDGLRPAHQAGNTEASMAFTDVPPNTPFNTVGMKKPIDIKKYDRQGHLVKSYESVPPGIQSLDTGPNTGTVVETPARMQDGDFLSTMGEVAGYLNPITAAGKLLGKGVEYVVDEGKQRLATNLNPRSYVDARYRAVDALKGVAEEGSEANNPYPDAADVERRALLKQVLGVEGDTLPASEYRENAYRSPETEKGLSELLSRAAAEGPEALNKLISDMEARPAYHDLDAETAGNVLGNFTVSRGKDDRGEYVDYYDVWDLNPSDVASSGMRPANFPFNDSTIENRERNQRFYKAINFEENIRKAEDFVYDKVLGLESPEIYGRIYLDDLNSKKRLGGTSKYNLRIGGVRYSNSRYRK